MPIFLGYCHINIENIDVLFICIFPIRTLCLTVILIRAGLEMDPVALWNLSGMVLRATFIPCFVEAAAVAGLSYFVMGFPITVGLMLGFVLAAVSPAVIIPCLISIAERYKEIPLIKM